MQTIVPKVLKGVRSAAPCLLPIHRSPADRFRLALYKLIFERTTLKRNWRQGVLFVHDPVDSSAQVAERRLALSYLELVRFGFAS